MNILKGRNLIIVEDDELYLKTVIPLLKELEVSYKVALTVDQAKLLIDRQAFDFMLTDLHIETRAGIDEPDGFRVIAYAKQQQPNITIIASSSDPRHHIWEGAHSAGAQQFLKKPIVCSDELVIGFGLARSRKFLMSQYEETLGKKEASLIQNESHVYDGIVIEPKLLQSLFYLAKKKNIVGIFYGETGTGKEELAKIVHKHRVALDGPLPFVAINCASIAENLAESQLFGHAKGAFTGADKATDGFIGKADGGILFLDEVHTLSSAVQHKLLRVLNDGSYNRLGESRTSFSRFQLLVATTRDLDEEVEKGRFLVDLRGRISGLEVKLPPLRERKHQIPALCSLFLTRKGINLRKDTFARLCENLQEYHFRANIRQLFSILEAWLIRCELEGLDLDPKYLPFSKSLMPPEGASMGSMRPSSRYSDLFNDLSRALDEYRPLNDALEILEKATLINAIQHCKTLGQAADILQVSRSALDMKRKKYQIT